MRGGGASSPPALELRHVGKSFGKIQANDDVSLKVAAGTLHALVGENGAGKSTAMRIAYGLLSPDRGEVVVDGAAQRFASPQDAIRRGVGMVQQHFALVDALTIAENVVLGAEPGSRWIFDRALAAAQVAQLSRQLGFEIDPWQPVARLSVGERQRVELLKVLHRRPHLLILDEPTAVLAPQEASALLATLRQMRQRGYTVVLITHKLSEVLAVADAVTVMRDGRVVATRAISEVGARELAHLIVGRHLPPRAAKAASGPGPPVLVVQGLKVASPDGALRLDGVSFTVRAGEIVAIAAIEGNGQTELVETLAGLANPGVVAGSVTLGGLDVARAGARHRRGLGMAHVPEDRQRRGLILDFDLAENSILGAHYRPPAATGPLRSWLDRTSIARRAAEILADFEVQPARLELPARNLSGGNQQRLVVGRELSSPLRLLLAAQPTRGVDLAGAALIQSRMVALRDAGCAVLLMSSDLDEVLALADRVLVMHRGRISGELDPTHATLDEIGLLMTGGAAA